MPARLWLLLLAADWPGGGSHLFAFSLSFSFNIYETTASSFFLPLNVWEKEREKKYRKSSSLTARKRMFSPSLNVLREELTPSSSLLIKTGHLYKPRPPVPLFDHMARCSHPAMFTHGDRWRPSSQPSYQNKGLRGPPKNNLPWQHLRLLPLKNIFLSSLSDRS